jgi:hypothetical protein
LHALPCQADLFALSQTYLSTLTTTEVVYASTSTGQAPSCKRHAASPLQRAGQTDLNRLSWQADPALRYPIAPIERLRNPHRRHTEQKIQRETRRLSKARVLRRTSSSGQAAVFLDQYILHRQVGQQQALEVNQLNVSVVPECGPMLRLPVRRVAVSCDGYSPT